MKLKQLMFIGLFYFATNMAFSQYRISRIEEQRNDKLYTTSFQYAGDQLISYVEESPETKSTHARRDVYNLKYDKNKVTILENNKKKSELKFEKDGTLKETEYIKLIYKKGELKEFEEKDKVNKYSYRYKMLNNELGHLSVITGSKTSSLYDSYLIYNNEEGQCIRFLNITSSAFTDPTHTHREDAIVEWENGRITRISGLYRNHSSEIALHEFFYDKHGLLCEEKVYSQRQDGTNELERHIKITYEPGMGNADKVYMPCSNWLINVLLGQQTFCYLIPSFY
ncbi:hypothetical protein [Dysgonomonas sp. 25]|uniref:hypothetical protein n=1 Tax=Dysgonomonas sp. 25 TaxID=2302933 RepID=UPI0013D6E9C2|nr:hypothetical protein [Dysgonomonas sp. 25]NDV69964.1 hypothetical protein [Dysgonomonas sp. 25]